MATTTETVLPAIIVGGGRLGKALQNMGSGGDILVKRGESVPLDFPGPIFVCTWNDDLDAVLESTPKSRWNDLVFFQDGMLEQWFESKGLGGDANQVLAYFSVAKAGEPPIDWITTDTNNPEGLTTAAYGKWAPAVAVRLKAGGLSCKVVLEKDAFEKQRLEKVVLESAVNLLGARHPKLTVGAVEEINRSEVLAIIDELAGVLATEKGIIIDSGTKERPMISYRQALRHFSSRRPKGFGFTEGSIQSHRKQYHKANQKTQVLSTPNGSKN